MRRWATILTFAGCLMALPSGAYAQKDVKSGLKPQVLSLPSGPGAIEGLGESYEPQLNTGASQYRVALSVPPGRAGLAPSLALSYDAGQGNGPLGLGWQISLMYIQRQTDKGLPRYGDPAHPDTFINEAGEELVRVQGNATDSLQTFRPKNESSFRRYEYHLEQDRWVCSAPSGVKYYLGAPAGQNSASGHVRRPGDEATFSWYCVEVQDPNLNAIRYTYESAQRQLYCRFIEYGGVGAASGGAFHQIELEWVPRPDVVVDYRPTFRLETRNRLKQVTERTAGQLVRRYVLQYHADQPLSLLASLTQYGRDGVSALPPAEFTYSVTSTLASPFSMLLEGLPGAYLLKKYEDPQTHPGAAELLDFNGDALPDFYQSHNPGSDPGENDILFQNVGGGHFSRINLGAAASAPLPIQSQASFVLDINGDGSPDLAAQKGGTPEDSAYLLNHHGRWDAHDRPFAFPGMENILTLFSFPESRAIDLNFDKRTDSLRSYVISGPSGDGVVFAAYFNNGDGSFWTIPQTMDDILKGLPAAMTFAGAQGRLVLADINGDRLQDLVLLNDASNGGVKFWPAMGYGRFDDSTAGFSLTGGPDLQGNEARIRQLEIQDLNGDGLADLYLIEGNTIRFWLSKNGFEFGSEKATALPAQYDPAYATYRLADINGDGLEEILFYVSACPTLDYLPLGFLAFPLFDPVTPNLLKTITNGIGRTTTITYRTSTDEMLRDRDAGRPWTQTIPFPFPVVGRIDTFDGMTTYSTEICYHDGYYDGEEKEFRGFAAAEKVDLGNAGQGAPTLVTAYQYDTGATEEALKGKPLAMEARTSEGLVFYRDKNEWTTRTLAAGAAGVQRRITFAFQNARTRDIRECGHGVPVRLHEEYGFDDYGNAIFVADYGRVEDNDGSGDAGDSLGDRQAWDDERITFSTYSAEFPAGQAVWILDRLVKQDITSETGTLVARTLNYYDDEMFNPSSDRLGQVNKGNLTMTRQMVSPSLAENDPAKYIQSVRNKYDAYGNIIAIYDPLAVLNSSGAVVDPGQGQR